VNKNLVPQNNVIAENLTSECSQVTQVRRKLTTSDITLSI